MDVRLVRMYRKSRELPVHDRLFTTRFGKPLTMWGITSNMRRLNPDETVGAFDRSGKAQHDDRDRNVIGHTDQMREVYNKERKLVPVK
jgi:hypothetical protein